MHETLVRCDGQKTTTRPIWCMKVWRKKLPLDSSNAWNSCEVWREKSYHSTDLMHETLVRCDGKKLPLDSSDAWNSCDVSRKGDNASKLLAPALCPSHPTRPWPHRDPVKAHPHLWPVGLQLLVLMPPHNAASPTAQAAFPLPIFSIHPSLVPEAASSDSPVPATFRPPVAWQKRSRSLLSERPSWLELPWVRLASSSFAKKIRWNQCLRHQSGPVFLRPWHTRQLPAQLPESRSSNSDEARIETSEPWGPHLLLHLLGHRWRWHCSRASRTKDIQRKSWDHGHLWRSTNLHICWDRSYLRGAHI